MEKSISFYEDLLDMKVSCQNFNRWAEFHIGNCCIALYNPQYDEELMKNTQTIEKHYSKDYLDYNKSKELKYGNNFVLNFGTDDLNAEYERLKKLNIGKLTDIMYLNIAMPYYFFVLEDPDGNQIEITG